MNTLQERIKLLRKKLDLNQEEFAEKIGLKRSALSLIEIGKNPLTEQNIKLICLTFNVSRDWLESGEGEIFVSETPEDREFLELYRQLSSEMKDIVFEHVKTLAEAEKRKKELENEN
ncbi:helix-turn-helix transcriptional regulator [Treponema denticola]|uniref:helix-turn-helix domain-containing protein n=1 Tax=Treponema denticola TaxID=158 RepID=UPI0020A52BA6|nr:helix-turn-helix transcriptional regulator [Treponema denticola]UTD07099.1 helix-turn-helix transcriptional regulator [Treponema denticola]